MRAISFCLHDVADPGFGERTARTANLYTLDLPLFQQHLHSIELQNGKVDKIEDLRAFERFVPVFLTFDDGARSALSSVAGELEKRNWRGHFFVTTDWIGQPGFLEAREIRELRSRGHVIGSHSCSHPERMSHLSAGQMMCEWTRSCTVLSDILGDTVVVASIPGGYYSRRVAETAAASGIKVLFTSEPTVLVSLVEGCMVLGRYSITRYSRPAASGALVAGGIGARCQQFALWNAKKIAKLLGGESYLSLRRYLVSRRFSKG
jgi:hypothetical protein